MYRLLISFILLLLSINTGFSQSFNEAVFFTQNSRINRFHTIDDLEDLKKGELLSLYADRVKEIVTILPYISLTNEPGVRLSDVGIKEDSNHIKTLKKNKAATQEAIETTKTTVEELIPYADTERIIWTILYYEDIIKKMRIGIKGNF